MHCNNNKKARVMENNEFDIYNLSHHHVLFNNHGEIVSRRDDNNSLEIGAYYSVIKDKKYYVKVMGMIDFNTYLVYGYSKENGSVKYKKVNLLEITNDCIIQKETRFNFNYIETCAIFSIDDTYSEYDTIRDKVNYSPLFNNIYNFHVSKDSDDIIDVSEYVKMASEWNGKTGNMIINSINDLKNKYIGNKVEIIYHKFPIPFIGEVRDILYNRTHENGIVFPIIEIYGDFKAYDGQITSKFFDVMKDIDYIKIIES